MVLAADVIHYLGRPKQQQAFLSQLGPSINENSRLWVLRHRFDADFDSAEFADWSPIIEALRFPGAQAVLVERLRPELRAALGAQSAARELGGALLEDLNRMLEDPTLWPGTRK